MIRLLHCGHWAIEEHNESQAIPDYAILSHTWELPHPNGDAKEVDYEDIKSRIDSEDPTVCPSASAQLKSSGWSKIENARKEVWELGLAWIWIDSCCIDNSDHQEHTEAINSMYQWYQNSQVCIAYLSDLQGKVLGRNRWFYRGWTLQELIAPPAVFFYNQRWEYCGSRNGRPRSLHQSTGSDEGYAYEEHEDLSTKISQITSIDQTLLRKNDPGRIKQELSTIPACQKMHWAWQRTTSRTEDIAYCLIGIFDINHFYLKRGERDGAFIRLQEEIVKQNGDPTLFAWRATKPDECVAENRLRADDLRLEGPPTPVFAYSNDLHGVFACRPAEFQYANCIQSSQHIMYNDEIAVTSKGVKFSMAALWGVGPTIPFTMSINSYHKERKIHLGIRLRWVGGNVYARTDVDRLEDLDIGRALPSQDDIYISRKIHYIRSCVSSLTENAFRLPPQIQDGVISLTRVSVSPGVLWSETMDIFLTSGTKLPVGYASYSQDHEPSMIFTLLFGLNYINEPWSCLIGPGSELAPTSTEMRRPYLDRVWRKAFQLEGKKASLASKGVIYAAQSTISTGPFHIGGHTPFVIGLRATKNSKLDECDGRGVVHHLGARTIGTATRSTQFLATKGSTADKGDLPNTGLMLAGSDKFDSDTINHRQMIQTYSQLDVELQQIPPNPDSSPVLPTTAIYTSQHEAETRYSRRRSYMHGTMEEESSPHDGENTREKKRNKYYQMGITPAMHPGSLLKPALREKKRLVASWTSRPSDVGDSVLDGSRLRQRRSRPRERPELLPEVPIRRESGADTARVIDERDISRLEAYMSEKARAATNENLLPYANSQDVIGPIHEGVYGAYPDPSTDSIYWPWSDTFKHLADDLQPSVREQNEQGGSRGNSPSPQNANYVRKRSSYTPELPSVGRSGVGIHERQIELMKEEYRVRRLAALQE